MSVGCPTPPRRQRGLRLPLLPAWPPLPLPLPSSLCSRRPLSAAVSKSTKLRPRRCGRRSAMQLEGGGEGGLGCCVQPSLPLVPCAQPPPPPQPPLATPGAAWSTGETHTPPRDDAPAIRRRGVRAAFQRRRRPKGEAKRETTSTTPAPIRRHQSPCNPATPPPPMAGHGHRGRRAGGVGGADGEGRRWGEGEARFGRPGAAVVHPVSEGRKVRRGGTRARRSAARRPGSGGSGSGGSGSGQGGGNASSNSLFPSPDEQQCLTRGGPSAPRHGLMARRATAGTPTTTTALLCVP